MLEHVSMKHNKKKFKHKAAASPAMPMVNTVQYQLLEPQTADHVVNIFTHHIMQYNSYDIQKDN
jgi:alcohol dehydrogenase YqhD (iron-dependent ADH family)